MNNAYSIFTSRVEERNIPNTIPYVELFMNTMKRKNNFCNEQQHEMQKRQNGGGNNAYKIFFELGEGGKHSKQHVLSQTIHDSHEKEK